MTHLLLPVASAFLAVPYTPGRPDPVPDRHGDLPLRFLLFCAVCAVMPVVELVWPPVAVAVSSVEIAMVPLL